MKNLIARRGYARPVLSALVSVALLAATGCGSCPKPECGLAITSPADGATLQPGDVKVDLTAIKKSFCSFGASRYEVRLDDGLPASIGAVDNPSTTFAGVGPGHHVAVAVAYDVYGKPMANARTRFEIPYPPEPSPFAPTPTPTPAAAAAAPAPVPAAATPAAPAEPKKDELRDVFFDLDKWSIREDQKATIEHNVAWLKAHPNAKAQLMGFHDERGSAKRNAFLNKARSEAVKKALVKAGIPAARLSTGAWDGDKFAEGSNEVAWQQNRRTHVVVRED